MDNKEKYTEEVKQEELPKQPTEVVEDNELDDDIELF